jgi:hypothetical protein
MKQIAVSLTVSLTLAASICAQQSQQPQQRQEGPEDKLHREYPRVQMLVPTDPPYSYNFDTKQWEQDERVEVADLPPDPDDLLGTLRKMMAPAHNTGSAGRRKNLHHYRAGHRRQ